jgi:peptidoglycan-associated lipoprotein
VIIYSPIPKDQEVVFFSKGAADLSDVAESTLITQAAILRANSSERATVKGYASSDEGDNRDTVLRLSMMRAIAVRDRLVDLGVLAERLTVEAHGADAVIVTKDTEEIRQGLRRVVVFVAPRLVQ